MKLAATLHLFYQPYVDSARLLHRYGVVTYNALTSDTAKDIYRTLWILVQVTFWLAVLACLYTIKLGRQFRIYYKAEWSNDVNRLVQWLITYPERCLEPDATDEALEPQTPPIPSVTLPEVIQSILDSEGTTTRKLRKIASYYKVPWRNTRGKGKHTSNADLKASLKALCPEVLAAL